MLSVFLWRCSGEVVGHEIVTGFKVTLVADPSPMGTCLYKFRRCKWFKRNWSGLRWMESRSSDFEAANRQILIFFLGTAFWGHLYGIDWPISRSVDRLSQALTLGPCQRNTPKAPSHYSKVAKSKPFGRYISRAPVTNHTTSLVGRY